ncbi:hypothetical protein F5Y17DRAFT_435955 [Xylariaceae sp. FL0594]|nr:hypothetical protein F5Y17DRAFT_435955 [Xylariaceae sp. FL0594]
MSDLGDSDWPSSLDSLSYSPPWAGQADFDIDNDDEIDGSDIELTDAEVDIHGANDSIDLDSNEDLVRDLDEDLVGDLDEDLDGDLDGDLDEDDLELIRGIARDVADLDEEDLDAYLDDDLDESEETEEDHDEDEDLDESDGGAGVDEIRDWVERDDNDDLDIYGAVDDISDLDFGDVFGYHFHDEDDGISQNLLELDAEIHFDAIHELILENLRSRSAMTPPPRSADHGRTFGVDAPARRRGRDQLVEVAVGGQARGPAVRRGERGRPLPEIIDLTGDEDHADIPPSRHGDHSQPGNLRRQRSQPQNGPPRLNRSDGSYIDDQQVIVLTSSDDEEITIDPAPRRSAHNNAPQPLPGIRNLFDSPHNRSHHHHHHHHQSHHHRDHASGPHHHPHHHLHHNNVADRRGARSARSSNQSRQSGAPYAFSGNQDSIPSRTFGRLQQFMQSLPLFQLMNHPPTAGMAARNNRPDNSIDLTGVDGQLFPDPGMGFGHIHLNYGAHAFANLPNHGAPAGGEMRAKPPHEPPKPARPGFTRDTGEDVVAICPSCDEELAYDPEGDGGVAPPATPAKKPSRSRKAQAEHHFWAVKACGHVYCKKCFDNRRPTKTSPDVGFRPDPAGSKKMLCAVEDCDSEISSKAAWVGIFM